MCDKLPLRWADLPPGPQVMAVVNVTPDSFSDGGRHPTAQAAIAHGEHAWEAGAAILDIGGESTRPGAAPVPLEEEQRRILPVIAALARAGCRISVDTRNADTMARALDAGASIVNDVSALAHDEAAAALVAARDCPVILMHMRGTPETMRSLTDYDDVVTDVLGELRARLRAARAAGIALERIAIDPGFGFAKTGPQSADLLRQLKRFLNLSCPIIAGLSRKRFLGALAQVADAAGRDAASVAAGLFALSQGASVLRVHDVASTVQAVRVWVALGGMTPPDDGETM